MILIVQENVKDIDLKITNSICNLLDKIDINQFSIYLDSLLRNIKKSGVSKLVSVKLNEHVDTV